MENYDLPQTESLGKKASSEIIFNADIDGSWVMKLTTRGIFFNRDKYSESSPDDFAKAVIEILEKKFDVTFNRRQPPYDKEGK